LLVGGTRQVGNSARLCQMEVGMRILLTAAMLVMAMGLSAEAVIISADADGFVGGSDISGSFSGLALSSVGGYSGLDGSVYAWGDGLASTPTSVFANNLSFQRQWYAGSTEGFGLRADFEQPADYVAIDIIGDDAGGDVGILYAYDSAGVLLDSAASGVLGYGEVFTAEISRAGFDIAYIIAGGEPAGEHTVHLDNLTANVIPEPATLSLLAFGALAAVRMRKVRK